MRTGEVTEEIAVPVVEERLVVERREAETGRVWVRTTIDETVAHVNETVVRGHVEIDRVAIGEEILEIPPVRDEGDTIVIPVVREEVVVSKRLILVEEVYLRRVATTEAIVESVTLRSQRAVIERQPPSTTPPEEI